MRKKCLVLLSGGIDSAVLLWWAKKRRFKLSTLTFVFTGRRKMELARTRKLSRKAGCEENYEIPLSFLDCPKSEESCYIPKRNLMYYGIAASLAETIGAHLIMGGHHKTDGFTFKDARKSYLNQIKTLVQTNEKGNRRTQLQFPFLELSKKAIVQIGSEMRVPFECTWSCSLDRRTPCWKCSSCKEREKGFASARISDPCYEYKK